MFTASVTLTQPILLDPTNPTQSIVAGTGVLGSGTAQRIHTRTLEGEFREYAGNRTRVVNNAAVSRQIPVVLKGLTAAQARLIDTVWMGRTVLFRDTYGTRLFCAYLSSQLLNLPRSSQGAVKDVALALQLVTYNEAV